MSKQLHLQQEKRKRQNMIEQIDDIEKEIDVEIVLALMSGKVTNAINRRLSRDLHKAQIDISPAQANILFVLWRNDGIIEKKISTATYKDKPSITRVIDNMEKMGLVCRKKAPKDRRINRIFLTEKAQQMKTKVKEVARQTVNDAFKGLDDKEISDVQRLMKMIFNNLEMSEGSI